MTKGERVAYAINEEISRNNLCEWLEDWRIPEEDYDKFLEAGKSALTEEEEDK